MWLSATDIEGLISSVFWAQGAQENEVFTNRRGVTSQKPSISISTVVRTSDFTDVGSVVLEYSLVTDLRIIKRHNVQV